MQWAVLVQQVLSTYTCSLRTKSLLLHGYHFVKLFFYTGFKYSQMALEYIETKSFYWVRTLIVISLKIQPSDENCQPAFTINNCFLRAGTVKFFLLWKSWFQIKIRNWTGLFLEILKKLKIRAQPQKNSKTDLRLKPNSSSISVWLKEHHKELR